MLHAHENNLNTKIANNYGGKKAQFLKFKVEKYLPFRSEIESVTFTDDIECFKKAAKLINDYYNVLTKFIEDNGVKSQSKLESSFLEEVSVYLFKDLKPVKQGKLDFFNKAIFAGLKINNDLSLDIITKDVDFCIGRKIKITIEGQSSIQLTVPVVSVEVKTYLDATMFGEVKSSSKTLKSANPNSRAYVLMGYKDLKDEHIFAARQDSTLDEMFVLRSGEGVPIDVFALYIYWLEIYHAINKLTASESLSVPGRLLKFNDMRLQIMKGNKPSN